jgi:hypothetical protein
MQIWQELLSTALVGVERQAPRLVPTGHPVDALLEQLDPSDREQLLLVAAGVLTLWRRAGQQPVTAQPVKTEPSELDDLPRCSGRCGHHLRLMLDRQYESALPEWFSALAAVGKRVPEEYLPELLELGHMQPTMRPLILPVLGRRGHWLAAQNPDWHYAAARDQDIVWQTGNHDERLFLLRQLRTEQPAHARELLTSTWQEESAQDRTSFLAALSTGLSMADESFLESALDDRSKEVRRTAAELLAHLSESHLVQRMTERAKALLTFKRGRISGGGQIEVTFPEQLSKDVLRDGVEPKPPAIVRRVGDKAWQLMQIIGTVPPSCWSRTWGKTPRELIRAAGKSEWRSSLMEGWALATQRHRDVEWAEALLDAWPAPDTVMESLVEVLPVEQREALALRLLRSKREAFSPDHPALAVLQACQHVWSVELSRAVLSTVRRYVEKQKMVDWRLHSLFSLFGSNLPTELLEEAGRDWPEWALPTVEKFMALLQFRHDMLSALQE